MHANSAQSASCKKSVHVQEVLRSIMNTSSRLNWNEEVAPVLTDYMGRMFTAGYSEGYRKSEIQLASRILDRKKQDEVNGIRPFYRKKEWEADKRKIDKKTKKHSWSTKGDTLPLSWFLLPSGVSWPTC